MLSEMEKTILYIHIRAFLEASVASVVELGGMWPGSSPPTPPLVSEGTGSCCWSLAPLSAPCCSMLAFWPALPVAYALPFLSHAEAPWLHQAAVSRWPTGPESFPHDLLHAFSAHWDLACAPLHTLPLPPLSLEYSMFLQKPSRFLFRILGQSQAFLKESAIRWNVSSAYPNKASYI